MKASTTGGVKGRLMGQTQRVGDSPNLTDKDAQSLVYCPACEQEFPSLEPDKQAVCPEDGTRLVCWQSPMDSLVGRVLDDRFEVRERLGAGAMGVVYCAWQASIGREVAIKVIDPRLGHDRTTAKRFFREARMASRLSQPNTVAVYDFGQTKDGLFYLVMERLRGQTLRQTMRKTKRFSINRTINIGVQLCDALEAAHGMGIIHRDLKPSNLFILAQPPGRDLLKVLDFGLAKSLLPEKSMTMVTGENGIVGTPTYMAPEVIAGNTPDQRCDLYAVGVILYEMLSGKSPFVAETVSLVYAKHLHDPVPPLPSEIAGPKMMAFIEALLAKDPENRPKNASEVRRFLVSQRDAAKAGNGHLHVSRSDKAETSLAATIAKKIPNTHHLRRLRFGVIGFVAIVIAALVIGVIGQTGEPDSDKIAPTLREIPLPVQSQASTTPNEPGANGSPMRSPLPDASMVLPIGGDLGSPVAQISVVLMSKPRATVFIGGKKIGKTPIKYEVPQSDIPVELEFSRPGYRTKRQYFVPQRDENISVSLKPKRRRPTRSNADPVEKPRTPPPIQPPHTKSERPKANFILPSE